MKRLLCIVFLVMMSSCGPAPEETALQEVAQTAPAQDAIAASSTKTPTPAPTSTKTPGLRVSDIDGMVMVYVPEGKFVMGSENPELEGSSPVHTVYLDSFWIDQTEVTNGMYQECVEAGGCKPPRNVGSYTRDFYYGNPDYVDYPVIFVDWFSATDYCTWAGRRLPTEAEWEKAARGTNGAKFPWGNGGISGNLLNFADRNSDVAWADQSIDDGYADTAPVGSYPDGTSPYGVLNMAGNVNEWVADWYDGDYYGISPEANPTGPTLGTPENRRVFRGVSFIDIGFAAESALRRRHSPSDASKTGGFRCAASP
jgi:formylglycine-generating enzyme required for sulfatase activity